MKKLQKPSLVITVIIAVCLASLVLLIKLAGNPRNDRGGFRRLSIIPTVKLTNICNITGLQILDLCGTTNSSLFFYTSHLQTILQTDNNLRNPHLIYLTIDTSILKTLADTIIFATYIDSPYVTICLHNSASILSGSLYETIGNVFQVNSKFNNPALLSRYSVMLKRSDSAGSNLLFSKVNFKLNKYLDEKNITAKLNDGGFTSDGKISFDRASGMVLYTYFYSNKMILFDTNLNVQSIMRTLDTFSQYQASAINLVIDYKSAGYSFNKPPKLVNYCSVVYSNKIYINSLIRSDNENEITFIKNSVVDVYDFKKGGYIKSFYIPMYGGRKLHRFEIVEDRVLVFYQDVVACYTLPD